MSVVGHFRPFDDIRVMSALPPIASEKRKWREVGLVPLGDITALNVQPRLRHRMAGDMHNGHCARYVIVVALFISVRAFPSGTLIFDLYVTSLAFSHTTCVRRFVNV
jgi:hypothetical protein